MIRGGINLATPNRFAIREVAEATFYSLSAPYNAKVTLKTLKTSGVETKSATTYARGGRGNAKLIGFSSDKEARITLQDAIIDSSLLAILTGNELEVKATEVNLYEDLVIPSTSPYEVKLSKVAENIISVHILDADGVTLAKLLEESSTTPEADKSYTYDDASYTFTFNAGQAGNKIRVYYTATTDATARTIKVTADNFGGSFKLVLDCLVRGESDKKDYAAQLIVYNGKIEDDWKIEMASTGDPTVIDIPIEVLKNPANTDMWALIIYDDSLIESTEEETEPEP